MLDYKVILQHFYTQTNKIHNLITGCLTPRHKSILKIIFFCYCSYIISLSLSLSLSHTHTHTHTHKTNFVFCKYKIQNNITALWIIYIHSPIWPYWIMLYFNKKLSWMFCVPVEFFTTTIKFWKCHKVRNTYQVLKHSTWLPVTAVYKST